MHMAPTGHFGVLVQQISVSQSCLLTTSAPYGVAFCGDAALSGVVHAAANRNSELPLVKLGTLRIWRPLEIVDTRVREVLLTRLDTPRNSAWHVLQA